MQTAIDDIVESLCQSGCKTVWGYIAELEAGRVLVGMESLNDVERHQVLLELQEIMAVYGQASCTLDDSIAVVEAKYATGS